MHKDVIASLGRRSKRLLRSSALAALVVYFLLATAITYPFLFSPRNTLTAPVASDFTSSVTVYASYVRERINPFSATHITSVAQPDGLTNNYGVNRVSFLSVTYLWLASYVIGPIAAHSLETFLGFLLTALVMFLFVRSLTRSAQAGFIAGLIYGFWPLMLGLGRAEPTYTHMWLYVLPMWAFWLLAKDTTPKRTLLTAASILPALFWTPYFAFHILVVGMGSMLVASWFVMQRRGVKRMLLVTGSILAIWLIAYVTYYLLGSTGPASGVPTRTLAEAYQQAAHPLMYILPGESPIWGKSINQFLVRLVPTAANTSLYVGLSVLALAIFGFVQSFKMHGKKQVGDLYVGVTIFLAVVFCCFIFSLAPTVTLAGHAIPTPNYVVVKFVPALRAGQRLAMPLMGAMAAMAGVGAYYVLRRFSGRNVYLALAILVGVLGVDLWSPYPNSSTKISVPASISQLRSLPDGRVAQYQANSLVGYPAEDFCLSQMGHGKPIINDCGLARPATNLALPPPHLAKLILLPLCQQLPALRALNVRYLIVPNNNYMVLQCVKQTMPKNTPILRDAKYQIFDLR